MNPWALVSFGLMSALIAAFFWVMVIPNGPTAVGVLMTIAFTGTAVVLLLVGCVGAGVHLGRKSD